MNIKITHKWLLEYLETDAKPDEIREYLSLCGPSVESVVNAGDDHIYDVEVISNRIDYASVKGMAREAGAILPRFGKKAKFVNKPMPKIEESQSLSLTIEDQENLCPRKLAIVMEVKVGKSPDYIKERLENCGIRSLNNLIDVTNYIMLETGHPTHVFDYDRIKTGKIVVRHAKKGEKIVTLDGKSYQLDDKDIVFDDGTGRIIDLPGIMGLENSVVNDETRRIVFWIETNDATAIRRTSMRLGIRTVAASINEKHPDTKAAYEALMRGADLFGKNASGKVMSKIYDTLPKDGTEKEIETDYFIFDKIIGMTIKKEEVDQILSDLGFVVKSTDSKKLKVTVPSFRSHDIAIPEDLVEEVARIYGYHNIDSLLQPMVYVEQPKEMENLFVFQNKIKLLLKHLGANEIINYSMVPLALLEEFGIDPKDTLRLSNSISTDIEYLRTALSPSLYKNIKDNEGKKESMKFFEIGKVYLKREGDLPNEEYRLGIATNTDYFDVKGLVEAVLRELHIERTVDYEIQEKDGVFMAELKLEDLIANSRPFPTYKPINQYAVIKLDKTFELSDKITYSAIAKKAYESRLLTGVEVLTVYKNKLTLRFFYSSSERNITEEEVKKELESV